MADKAKSSLIKIESDSYPEIRWGVKLVNGNVGCENGVLTLPQWCAFRLPEIIRAKEGLITPDERKALGQ